MLLWTMALAAETCGPQFDTTVSWEVGGRHLTLDRGVLTADERVLGTKVREADVQADHAVFVQQGRNGLWDLVAYDASTDRRFTLVGTQTPAQAVLSDDGSQVGFVNGVTGLTAVYVMDFDGGEPRQLTNVDLVRQVGKPPVGFTPSPSQGLFFAGNALVWDGPERTHRVEVMP